MKRSGWHSFASANCGRSRLLASVVFVLFLVTARPFPVSAAGPGVKAGAPPVRPATPAGKSLAAPVPQSPAPGPRIWLGSANPVKTNYVGVTAASQSRPRGPQRAAIQNSIVPDAGADPATLLAAGNASARAMASADIDSDGYDDLIAGYAAPGGQGVIAIHRGNIDAFAPQSKESFLAIGQGNFPSPFLANANVFTVPVVPDFVATGDFYGFGYKDLVVAARGSSVVYVFPNDGKGNFGDPQSFNVPGAIDALASGQFGHSSFGRMVVGVSTPAGSSVLVYGGSTNGLVALSGHAVAGPISSIAFGDMGGEEDAVFVSAGQPVILRSSSLELVTVSLPVSVKALTLGTFIFNRYSGLEMALLSTDGSIQIAVRNEFDPRPYSNDEWKELRKAAMDGQRSPITPVPSFPSNGWKIAETFSPMGAFDSSQPAAFFRTRISNHGPDDVMLLNGLAGQMTVISHPDVPQGSTTFAPGQISVRPYSGSPVSAVSVRTNVDYRPGVVTLHQGENTPSVLMPLPDPTFFPNRFDDITPRGTGVTCLNTVGVDGSNDCTLREAILKANGDNISLQAGTYTLSLPKVANDCTGNHGALSIDRSMTIFGAAQNSTFIQAGTTSYNPGPANGVDMVMNVNEDLATANCPNTNASLSLSNLTIQNGHNLGTHSNDGDGGCMEFDTGTSGTATLSLTNVTLRNCDTTQGNGGGLASFNFLVNGAGMPTITNSIIQGNKGFDSVVSGGSSGGGIFVSDPSRMLMTGSQVLNNIAGTGTGVGLGGGLRIFSNVSGSRQTVIHNSTISGNTANGSGGGIWASANLLIDQGTIISGNTGGVGNLVNSTDGGGLFLNTKNPDSVTLSHVTITGNHAPHGNGGGVSVGNLSVGFGTLTMNFSRLAGNTVGGTGSNLNNIDGTVTVLNNWWGTNTPATTIRNDPGGAAPSTATFDPFIVLTHTASPNKIRINQSTTLTADMSKDNHGSGVALSGNLDQIIGIPITFNNAVDGGISGAQTSIQPAGTATATFNAANVAGGGKADAVVDQATVTANIVVLQPPSIAKSFSPTVIKVGGTSTITFSITNPNVVTINASFTDDLTSGATVSGLVVAATPNVVNGCGGSVTAVAGANSISFLNAALPVSGPPCTITVDVTGTSDGIKPNSVTIDSTDAGNGNTAVASPSLTVINPPTINKVFGAATIPLNGTTSLTFTITNPNSNGASVLNGISFTDTLPSGLVVATPNGLTNTCSTTPTAVAGSGTVSLTGASLAAGASCTISVNVQGTTAGVKNNSVTVSDTIAGTGNTSSTSLTVVAPPTISKSFSPKSVPLGSNSTLSFTVTNPNTASALSGIAFTDSLPGGVKLASTTVTGSCGSGTITATINNPPGSPSTVSLSGGTLTASPAAGSSCTFSVSVTGITAGAQVNTTSTVSSTEGGTGGTASDTLIVVAPPTISKSFSPKSIPLNSNSTLSFTVTNPNTASALSGVAFTDSLPGGVKLASTTVTGSCGSGTITATINNPPGAPSTVSLSGGTLTASPAAGSSCTFSVSVTGISAGTQVNTTSTVSSTEGGTGGTASDTLTVIAPATISKSFSPKSIPLNGNSTLSFTLTNPNTVSALSGVAFTDTLPGGLKLASTTVTGSCGSGTITATINNPPGSPSTISLSGGTLTASPDPASSCTFSVNVTGISAGAQVNTTSSVSSTEGGTGGTATDTLTVIAPPTIAKSFAPKSIPLNGNSTLSFTLTNPNTTSALSGVSFTDTLPGGVKLASTTVTGSCGSGTITATINNPPGTPSTVSLSGGTLTASPAAGSSCTFSVSITGIAAGTQVNTTSTVSSTEGGTGGTATDTLTVVAPPTISKAFGAANIALNGTTTVTFTITNPASNTSAENGIAFSDTLTNGLQVASTPGVTNSCGGTVTAAANSTSISLTGGSIATPGSTCTIVVNVTGTQSGTVTNTTGAVSSTNGGTGATSNTATLIVASPATVTKTFAPTKIALNGTTLLTINITNPNSNVSLTGLSFTDSLPAGLVVASPANLNNTCSGTATATAGAGSVSLSGGTVASSASCAVSVNVQGTTAGDKLNSVTVSSTEGGASTGATATVTVVAPPTISKAFNPTSIAKNGTSTVTFTISNPNNPGTPANGDLTGVAFSDTLPVSGGPGSATLVVSGTPNVSNTCGGTVTATAGTGVISLSSGSVAHNTSCTLSVDVKGTVEGDGNNTTGAISSTEGGTGTTSNTATLKVVTPPTISKAFGAANITLNGTTTVTFTITNPASNTSAENGIAFSDTLTNGLQVASTPGVTNSCGGTVTAAANTTSISLTGGSIATPGSTCTIVVNVTGTQSGTVSNTTGAVSSTNGGTGATSNTATLIVASPATVTKTFAPTKIPLNGTTLLTINITNPNSNVSLTGLSFTDSLPAGLVVASPANLNNTCGGTSTATVGSGTVSLSGGTLASSASCAVSVNVQGTTAGDKINNVVVSSTEGGASTGATATVTVVAPPTISKAFNPTSIAKNGTSTVTFTISNPNNPGTPANGDLTGVAFSDTLPVSGGPGSATLVVSGTPNVSNTCGGTVTATAGTGVISLSSGSVAHNTSCTLSVDVTGTVEGDASNTTGAISSTEGGTGTTSNTSTLKVVAPPTISKAFGAANIPLNGTTTVTFTITNPASNTSAENGVAFSDTLTNGLQVASTPGVTNSCGGTVTAAANSTSISLTGGSIATPGATCTIVVNVTGTQSGTVSNTTGAVSSTNGGTGATSNTATLTVAAPPTITKSFNPTQIPLNTNSTLNFSISNPNTNVALSGVAFTDSLPAGLVVATPNGLTGSCGSGTITAVAGSGSISLSGGTLASSGNCTFSVAVTGTTAGVKNNSVQVTSTEGGTGNTSNATLTVVGPPVLIKAFGAASIPLGGTTSLSFTIQNNNTTASLSGIGFSDTLPAGLIISTPNGLVNSPNGCTGTITATQGTNVISLSGATVAASSFCTFSVNVTGIAAGTQNNISGAITSTEGGTGVTASASIDVVAPPSIAKAFNPAGIPVNGTSSLTFTITNPSANGVSEAGVAFTDTLPASVTVANGSAATCGGTLTTTNPSTIQLTGATIAVNSQCQFSVTVTGTQSGVFTNTTGNVTSTNGGTGNTASADLTVAAPPTIAKSFSVGAVALNGTVVATFSITNPNNTVTLTGISFTDSLPAGLVVATPNGANANCGGTITAVPGSNSISFTGGILGPPGPPPIGPVRGARVARRGLAAAAGNCAVNVTLQATALGTQNNTTGPISANESGPGVQSNTATVEVIAPPTVAKAFSAGSIPLNTSSTLTFTFSNPTSSTPFVNLSLTDTLPAGLVVAATPNVAGTCLADGAAVTATAGSNTISVTNIGLPASSSCTLSVDVTGTSGGTKNNVSGHVTATFDDGTGTFVGITGNTASASIIVVAPPVIAKSFNPATIALNGTSVLSFTITNPAANTVALTGVGFTDTLPANVLVATPNGLTGSCGGGTITAVAGSNSVSLSGASIAASSSCTFSVNVTSSVAGTYTNTTSAVTSANGGNGNTASATLKVANANLSITKTHTGNFPRGGTGSYTITVSNNAAAGPTLGTVTVVDTLPNVQNTLVPTGMSGTGWSCTLATLTCTRSDALAPGASYPPITLNVNVPQNIQANVTNMATVSGGGDPNSHTASDLTHIGPPIQINRTGNDLQVIRGNQTSADFTVDSAPGEGTLNFACTGLPVGVTCNFNPASENQLSATVTLTINSALGSAPVAQDRNALPLYAFSFPVLGLVGVFLGGRKSRKLRLRMAVLFGLMIVLLALSGCGGGSVGAGGTPPATYSITMTATSATTGDSASFPFTLTVLSPGPQGH